MALTTFVGRAARADDLQELLAKRRLVTLVGVGGVGKTRLALHVATRIAGEFSEGWRHVDLARVTDPELVPAAVLRVLGIADPHDTTIAAAVQRAVGDRSLLMVLDNCEHVLDACARLVPALLAACPSIRCMATSRQPMNVVGEVVWRVPPLSLEYEAIELFTDRAELASPGFSITADNIGAVHEICRRLDGIPMAIELAAARVRSISPVEIANCLDDRFGLLTGGPHTAPRHQRTLRASMEWSYDLLTTSERIVLRRLAAFPATFDLAAAQVVTSFGDLDSALVFDNLMRLVDKSLVTVERNDVHTRYRLPETVRQYAAEKLTLSGESDLAHGCHRDHYTGLGSLIQESGAADHDEVLGRAQLEIDNLRAAFAWSRDNGEVATALQLASTLQPIWLGQSRLNEGLAWFDSILEVNAPLERTVPPGVLACALADKVVLNAVLAGPTSLKAPAQQALTLARESGDPAALTRALTASGFSRFYDAEGAQQYFGEARKLAVEVGDEWTLTRIHYGKLLGTCMSGDPMALRAAIKSGHSVAEAIGDAFAARQCRLWLIVVQLWSGDLNSAVSQSLELVAEAESVGDDFTQVQGLHMWARALAYRDGQAAGQAADRVATVAAALGVDYPGIADAVAAYAALAAGDVIAELQFDEVKCSRLGALVDLSPVYHDALAQSALAQGEMRAARRLVDEAACVARGAHLAMLLTTRARIALAQCELEEAQDAVQSALSTGAELGVHLYAPDGLELLAHIAITGATYHEAALLFGAAAALRQRSGQVRFAIWDADYQSSVSVLRDELGSKAFDAAWTEGAALSTEEAIAYTQRGRRKRKRPASGWGSLTPAERNIVLLVCEGFDTKDMAAKLFVSIRTVQTHLTHIYSKLGISSRAQLVEEAARHS